MIVEHLYGSQQLVSIQNLNCLSSLIQLIIDLKHFDIEEIIKLRSVKIKLND